MAKQNKAKKTYKKPEVTQVKLEVGEAVLAGCKQDPDLTGTTKRGKGCFALGCQSFQSVS
jgi:hypothetical protein